MILRNDSLFFIFYFLSSFNNPYITDCESESTTLKIRAVKKESTLKPPTIFAHNKIKIALITSKNNPKVKSVTGRVNRTRIGFTKIFSKPKTTATIIEVVKFSTFTPFIIWERTITNNAVIKTLRSNFIFLFIIVL